RIGASRRASGNIVLEMGSTACGRTTRPTLEGCSPAVSLAQFRTIPGTTGQGGMGLESLCRLESINTPPLEATARMVVETDRKLLSDNDWAACHTMRLASVIGRWRSPDMPLRRPVSLYRRDLPPFKMAQ